MAKAKTKIRKTSTLPPAIKAQVKALPARAEAPVRRKTVEEVIAERDAADARWRRLFVNQPKGKGGAKPPQRERP